MGSRGRNDATGRRRSGTAEPATVTGLRRHDKPQGVHLPALRAIDSIERSLDPSAHHRLRHGPLSRFCCNRPHQCSIGTPRTTGAGPASRGGCGPMTKQRIVWVRLESGTLPVSNRPSWCCRSTRRKGWNCDADSRAFYPLLLHEARFRQNVWQFGALARVPKNVWLFGPCRGVTYRSYYGVHRKGLCSRETAPNPGRVGALVSLG